MNEKYNIIEINGKRIKKSRLIMEKHTHRKLGIDEVVHHINGNKKDDRLCNLKIMKDYEHISLHHAGIKKGKTYREVLFNEAQIFN